MQIPVPLEVVFQALQDNPIQRYKQVWTESRPNTEETDYKLQEHR